MKQFRQSLSIDLPGEAFAEAEMLTKIKPVLMALEASLKEAGLKAKVEHSVVATKVRGGKPATVRAAA